MIRHLKTFTWVCLLFISYPLYSQPATRTITGLITSFEESDPLEGVSVKVKGSKTVSGSQSDGIYYIIIKPTDSILLFSYPQFEPQEIKITSSNNYDIVLKRKNTNFSPAVWPVQNPLVLGNETVYNFSLLLASAVVVSCRSNRSKL